MNTCILILFISVNFNYIQSQYNPLLQTNNIGNVCAVPSNTAAVEHFFNLIFSEFHSRPPVCVCVQMCPDQPTYCYPNGCLKKVEFKRKQEPNNMKAVSQIQADESKPMSFLVDSQSDFMENLLKNKFIAEAAPKIVKSMPDYHNIGNELHRDPFRDRYQSIFKYKKSPKLHLRYNLREQVKHTKSDVIKIEKIDIAKTRWPPLENKQFYIEHQNLDNNWDKKNNILYQRSAVDGGHYPSKFFKRDLAKKFKPKEHNFDAVEQKENITFSLENLIENLIEHSFGPLSNNTELDLNVNLDYNFDYNTTTIEPITLPYKRSVLDNNLVRQLILNETTNVISMNNTNENLDENKYNDDSNRMYKNVFNDMIASLSKHIEKNNNSSVEMMERVLGHRVAESDYRKEPPLGDELHANITTLAAIAEETSEKTITVTEPEKEKEIEKLDLRKKSHQRISRKLQNGKNN